METSLNVPSSLSPRTTLNVPSNTNNIPPIIFWYVDLNDVTCSLQIPSTDCLVKEVCDLINSLHPPSIRPYLHLCRIPVEGNRSHRVELFSAFVLEKNKLDTVTITEVCKMGPTDQYYFKVVIGLTFLGLLKEPTILYLDMFTPFEELSARFIHLRKNPSSPSPLLNNFNSNLALYNNALCQDEHEIHDRKGIDMKKGSFLLYWITELMNINQGIVHVRAVLNVKRKKEENNNNVIQGDITIIVSEEESNEQKKRKTTP